jgi:aryl carrier-like protein
MRLFTLVALMLAASSQITVGRAGPSNWNHPAACEDGDRGRLIRFEHVAAFPTAASARAYFDEWIAFYDGFYNFPEDLPVSIVYGFDSYRVTYCTVERLRRKGADVTVRTFSGFDHVTSWIFAMPRAVNWFRSLE